jgi:hypothetical protein
MVLKDTWASLTPLQRARVTQSELAERILTAAASGETDPDRLRARALMKVSVSLKTQAR